MASDSENGKKTEAERIAEWDAKVCDDLMSTPQGRFFVERWLDFCCEGRDLYLNDGDALGMAMRDGMARAGRWLRVKLEEHCSDRFLQMVRERRGRMARALAATAAREAAEASPGDPEVLSPIEAMADEQAREAAKEAEREAIRKEREAGKKKD